MPSDSRTWLRILHVDHAMTRHDLGIKRFSQYWRRAVRTGYAYAEVSKRYRTTELPLWDREARHNLVHGGAILAIAVGAAVLTLACGSLLPLLVAIAVVATFALRTAWRFRWKSSEFGHRFALRSAFASPADPDSVRPDQISPRPIAGALLGN